MKKTKILYLSIYYKRLCALSREWAFLLKVCLLYPSATRKVMVILLYRQSLFAIHSWRMDNQIAALVAFSHNLIKTTQLSLVEKTTHEFSTGLTAAVDFFCRKSAPTKLISPATSSNVSSIFTSK